MRETEGKFWAKNNGSGEGGGGGGRERSKHADSAVAKQAWEIPLYCGTRRNKPQLRQRSESASGVG